MCNCEDRPCCGCYSIAEIYAPAYDPFDPNNYDPDDYFG